MWYHVQDGQRLGPHSENAVHALIANGSLQPDTLVWKAGMDNWAPASTTELAGLFTVQAAQNQPVPTLTASQTPMPIQQDAHIPQGPAYTYQPGSFRKLWLWFAWLVGAGIPLCLILIGLIPAFAGLVLGFVLLYRFWGSIQDNQPRTTPGKAVGFCFIPFFNLYWCYVAYVGLAKDMNTYLTERNIPAPPVSEGLALAYFILMLCSMVPYLGLLCSLANIVILIMLYRQFAIAAEHITAHKHNQDYVSQ